MKLLITGTSGFIGKAFLELLAQKYPELNSDVILLTSNPVNNYRFVIHKDYTFTQEDLVILADSPYVCLHLGAFTQKATSFSDNIEECNANIVNTKYLIDNLPYLPKRFIFTSTIDVYSPSAPSPISESTLTMPGTMYGWSKLYCEEMLKVWAQANKVELQILRLGHIYGRGEGAYQKLIPITIKNIINGKALELVTVGRERRAFMHVSDCCQMIVSSILSNSTETVNIVSEHSRSVKEIMRLLLIVASSELEIKISDNPVKGRDVDFDASKMVHLFGSEQVDLESGLRDEYEYFLSEAKQ